MVRAIQKRFFKRCLELIGAVAVVYLMLEVLENQTSNNHNNNRLMVKLSESDGAVNEIAMSMEELQKLQEQIRMVQREQELQKNQPQQQLQQVHKPQKQQNDEEYHHVNIVSNIDDSKDEKNNKIRDVKPNPSARNNPQNQRRPPPRNVKKEIDPANMGPQFANDDGNEKSPDLGVKTNFEELNIPIPSLKSKGYVLPMLYFDMGPNNLFRLFREGAVTAYEMGRTVVVPVFHRHPRMGDQASEPFVLPIFDTNYTVDLVWPPSDTIDVGMLKKVLNLISMREFKRDCQGNLDALVQCGELDGKRMDGVRHFQRAAGMQVVKEFKISSYDELVPNDLSSGIIGPDEFKCMGIIYGKKCLPSQDRWLATFSRIANNFWRPMPVRRFALKFINQVMENAPFMAVHWRYESDWMDMCKPSRPKGSRDRNKEICRLAMGLTYDDDVRSSFVQRLKDKMADFSLKKIYLASPPNNLELIELLKENFPGNFFYLDDVNKFAAKSEGPNFITDNYKASFIEQEICFRSTLYLGAALSSWSQTVLTDRLARGIKRHDSVLEVVSKGAPGFPKLVFQFPEGNFKFEVMAKGKKRP